MSADRFEIMSRTDVDLDVSVITVADHGVRGWVWTLVSHACGSDVLVSPSGAHIDPNAEQQSANAADLIDWLVRNV